MFHNGTVSGLKYSDTGCSDDICKDASDTQKLANILSGCRYSHIKDIAPLVQNIITDYINRLVFLDHDGDITIFNEDLGTVEDDIWYSNDYHTKKKPAPTTYYTPKTGSGIPASAKTANGKTRVFVYGTLKQGFYNHTYLKNATYLGKATSFAKWCMVGKGMGFPYLLKMDLSGAYGGHNIKGEVYEVNSLEMSGLDRLEGYPYMYDKATMYVKLEGSDATVATMVYIKSTVTAKDMTEEFIEEFTKDNDPWTNYRKADTIPAKVVEEDDKDDSEEIELEEAKRIIEEFEIQTFKDNLELANMNQTDLYNWYLELAIVYYSATAYQIYRARAAVWTRDTIIDEIKIMQETMVDEFIEASALVFEMEF